ncbi:vacuolar-processing enzyme-like [Trifolium pratense]|uniref:vacuolar-processing enzyme-like n=1 Tax=Trifolium pratense TaxID=57577 RepID=UPI001E697472|nr:vacuolar-processing enzyme-like [Trifolium pratense]
MNHKNKYCVELIALIWMSATIRMLQSLHPLDHVFGHGTIGKKWALLVSGSYGYENYRHQADVCHAYQILKRGGLKDENIIVFMYDDIANHPENPRPGVLINHPNGSDVYHGVPKDYIGNEGNASNFYAVLSGNKSAVKGGSGKVLESGPNDTIFIYYTDHGAPGIIGMQDGGTLNAKDLIDALKKKHAAKSYKKMVIYLEACESGSMFEGLLPNDINIYAITASNATEDSWGFYCDDTIPPSPPEYSTTCLGDVFSISWMEDSDKNDMTKETLKQQYENVRRRTLISRKRGERSHVMQYGDLKMSNDFLLTYIGAHPTNINEHDYVLYPTRVNHNFNSPTPTRLVSQRDTRLIYLKTKLEKASNSEDKLKAQKELEVEIAHRKEVDNNVHQISNILFGEKKGSTMMVHVRSSGQPLVDDWDCLKKFIKTYESHCGNLSIYGRKYSRAFANMCNAGISEKQMVTATSQICKENK